MRFIALNDGASMGAQRYRMLFFDLLQGRDGDLRMTVIANHARMMGTENRWIVARHCLVAQALCRSMCSSLMRPSAGRGEGVHAVLDPLRFDLAVRRGCGNRCCRCALRDEASRRPPPR